MKNIENDKNHTAELYTEGKRLETMSLRLLDIMVTKKEGARMQKISTEMLFEYLQSLFLPKEEMDFRFSYEQAVVTADAGLIQTVLVNLIDNACKASEPGSRIEVEGHVLETPSVEWEQADKGKAEKQDRNRAEGRRIEKQDKVIAEGGKAEKADKGKKEKGRAEQEKKEREQAVLTGYWFSVRDYGIGIPEEEISKVTQAFYMVDKSRARSRNGAGLGLALSAEILALHGSRLKIESVPGQGTTVGFLLWEERREAQYEETCC